jgi:hypothetical protein
MKALRFCIYNLPIFTCVSRQKPAPLHLLLHHMLPIVPKTQQSFELLATPSTDVKGVVLSVTYPIPLLGSNCDMPPEALEVIVGDVAANEDRIVTIPIFAGDEAVDNQLEIEISISYSVLEEQEQFFSSLTVPIRFCRVIFSNTHIFFILFMWLPLQTKNFISICDSNNPSLIS